eukprot:3064857-Amphidinium_carterae.1
MSNLCCGPLRVGLPRKASGAGIVKACCAGYGMCVAQRGEPKATKLGWEGGNPLKGGEHILLRELSKSARLCTINAFNICAAAAHAGRSSGSWQHWSSLCSTRVATRFKKLCTKGAAPSTTAASSGSELRAWPQTTRPGAA